MIPELNIFKEIEEVKTIWESTISYPNGCLDFIETIIKKEKLMYRASIIKEQGISAKILISDYIRHRLQGSSSIDRSVKFLYELKSNVYGKDAMYRLLKSPEPQWSLFLYRFTKGVMNTFEKEIQEVSDGYRSVIIDDTTIKKRGKKIEGVTYVHDHTTNKKELGYKLLTASYHDGSTLYPLLYSIHSEGDAKLLSQGKSKIEVVMQWIRKLLSSKLPIDYFLFDSWYFTKQIAELLENRRKRNLNTAHFITKAKVSMKMEIEGKKWKIGKFIQAVRKKMKRSRQLHAQYYTDIGYIGRYKVRFFIVKFAGSTKKQVLITSDCSLSFKEACNLYSKRWATEVFYKEAKQLLRLRGLSEHFFCSSKCPYCYYISIVFHSCSI